MTPTQSFRSPEQLALKGWIVNMSATPQGCCAAILSVSKPYRIYRCQNAMTMQEAYDDCLKQMQA